MNKRYVLVSMIGMVGILLMGGSRTAIAGKMPLYEYDRMQADERRRHAEKADERVLRLATFIDDTKRDLRKVTCFDVSVDLRSLTCHFRIWKGTISKKDDSVRVTVSDPFAVLNAFTGRIHEYVLVYKPKLSADAKNIDDLRSSGALLSKEEVHAAFDIVYDKGVQDTKTGWEQNFRDQVKQVLSGQKFD